MSTFKYQHCYQAAAAGDLEELKAMFYAGNLLVTLETQNLENNVAPDFCSLSDVPNSIVEAAENGNLDCIKFAHENGAKWHVNVISFAFEFNHEDCLRYAIENGCPYDIEDDEIIAAINQLQHRLKTIKNVNKNSFENHLTVDVINYVINKFI